MISFRCWFCNRLFWVADERRGQRMVCSCRREVKVPRRSGGKSRPFRLIDFMVETLVYGGGGALLGFGLGLVIATRVPWFVRKTRYILLGTTLAGLVLGTVFGERGINWVGRWIRDWEERQVRTRRR